MGKKKVSWADMTTNSDLRMSDPDEGTSISFEDTGHTQYDRGTKK